MDNTAVVTKAIPWCNIAGTTLYGEHGIPGIGVLQLLSARHFSLSKLHNWKSSPIYLGAVRKLPLYIRPVPTVIGLCLQ